MKRCCLHWVLVLSIISVRPAAAQQSAGADPDREIIRQLLERVQRLEAEVKELKAQHAAAAPAPVEPTTPPAAPVTQAAQVTPPTPQSQAPMNMPDVTTHGSPSMNFRGFSDISYHASDERGTTNSFALGQFNMFITSKLSERVSVLAEAVLEADQHNTFGFELERLLLEYSASDRFNLNIGRYHTAIGWYNTAYHHSTWMQTAVGRPFIYEFEDEGGILPIHNVGISANGTIPSGSLGLRYAAEIGNGRASRTPLAEPVQDVVDENNGKSFNLALMARPDSLPGFQAGFSVYHDRLTPAGQPKIDEIIMAAHAVYQSSGFEWLNEGLMIRNAVVGTTRVVHTPSFYTQISRRFGLVRPYFRYQYLNSPDSSPVFSDVGLLYGPSVGIRYDFSDFAAFKIQYDRMDRRRLGGINGITTQLSFAF